MRGDEWDGPAVVSLMKKHLGRYEIIRRVAAGGMAMVHLGRVAGEGGFERLVAIKLMHEHLTEDPDFVAMFLDEARLAAGIQHPNVVSTLDVQRGPDGLFIVMDFVDGPSLLQIFRARFTDREQMPLGLGLRIVLDVLAGLNAAHELVDRDGKPQNLIHRDVSPGNILVGYDGIARIADFGVARAEARISSTRGDQLKGKLAYMAPERLSITDIDRRVDIYSAGCVLWEMLTLERLFRGDDEPQLIAALLAGPRLRPQEVRPDIPDGIDEACMQALGPREGRFRTAAAFAAALEEAADNHGIRVCSAREAGDLIQQMVPPQAEESSPDLSSSAPWTTPAMLLDQTISELGHRSSGPSRPSGVHTPATDEDSASGSQPRRVAPGTRPRSVAPGPTGLPVEPATRVEPSTARARPLATAAGQATPTTNTRANVVATQVQAGTPGRTKAVAVVASIAAAGVIGAAALAWIMDDPDLPTSAGGGTTTGSGSTVGQSESATAAVPSGGVGGAPSATGAGGSGGTDARPDASASAEVTTASTAEASSRPSASASRTGVAPATTPTRAPGTTPAPTITTTEYRPLTP